MRKRVQHDSVIETLALTARLMEKFTALQLLTVEAEYLSRSLRSLTEAYTNLKKLRQQKSKAPQLSVQVRPSMPHKQDTIVQVPLVSIVKWLIEDPSPADPDTTLQQLGVWISHKLPSSSWEQLRKWFATKKVNLLEGNLRVPNSHLIAASLLIGKFYSHFQPLLTVAKQCISQKCYRFRFTLNPIAYPDRNLSAHLIQQLLHYLHNSTPILRSYRRINSDTFQIRLKPTVEARHFFTGEWLEVFIQVSALYIVLASGYSDVLWARNLKVSYQDLFRRSSQQYREIDFFFLLSGVPFWFEAKSGKQRNALERYQELCTLLRVPQSYAFLVLPDRYSIPISPLWQNSGLTICSVTEFPQRFAYALQLFQRKQSYARLHRNLPTLSPSSGKVLKVIHSFGK